MTKQQETTRHDHGTTFKQKWKAKNKRKKGMRERQQL